MTINKRQSKKNGRRWRFFVLYIYLSPFHQIEPLGGGRIGPQDDVLGPLLHLDPVGGCPPHDQDVLRGDVQLDGVHSTEEDPEATAYSGGIVRLDQDFSGELGS